MYAPNCHSTEIVLNFIDGKVIDAHGLKIQWEGSLKFLPEGGSQGFQKKLPWGAIFWVLFHFNNKS